MRLLRLLIVDDSETFLIAAGRFLENNSLLEIAGTASSGRDALIQTPLLEPDLVLVDLMMTEMNGLEATRLLKCLPVAPAVIVMSLYDDSSFRDAALEAGADGFLPKQAFATELAPLLAALSPNAPRRKFFEPTPRVPDVAIAWTTHDV
jgi:DNA-binding NarL/FixJ family response regulator